MGGGTSNFLSVLFLLIILYVLYLCSAYMHAGPREYGRGGGFVCV